jgi:hypothetical protein
MRKLIAGMEMDSPIPIRFLKSHGNAASTEFSADLQRLAEFESWCSLFKSIRTFPASCDANRSELQVSEVASGKRLLHQKFRSGLFHSSGQFALSPKGTRFAIWTEGLLHVWTVDQN